MKISHGIDIVSVKRIRQSIRRGGISFLNRVFTPREIAYCKPRARAFEHYAARFAAKEAFVKALGPRAHLPALHTIEVGKHASGEPYIVPDAALLKKAGLTRRAKIRLSLSHDREYAAASVIILGS